MKWKKGIQKFNIGEGKSREQGIEMKIMKGE